MIKIGINTDNWRHADKPVDYCLIDYVSTPEERNLILPTVLEKLKPDVYAVNEEGFDMPFREEVTKKHGVELVILERRCPKEFEEISTSKIIDKIKNLD